jgi:DNA-3-methyladenine glycosylase
MNKLAEILNASAVDAAQRLLGCELRRELDGHILRARIVETEAYDQTDEASHSYRGQTPRTDVMFGPAGHLYVYFTYGMHYCCNVVVGQEGHGAAVLIRAVEPLTGQEIMSHNRHDLKGEALTNGPAKLCQAFQIDKTLNGHDLNEPPLKLIIKPSLDQKNIVQATRIGITQAKDVPWRFYEEGNIFVSRRA